MQATYLDVMEDERGLFPIVWGHADGDMPDWRGANFRYRLLPGWRRHLRLKSTVENLELLRALLASVDKQKLGELLYNKAGSSLTDDLSCTIIEG